MQAPALSFPLQQITPDINWRSMDFVSDFHLHPAHPKTVIAWTEYLGSTSADAIFLLGDIFEAWIGDDAALDAQDPFFQQLITDLQAASQTKKLYFMHGNRDFLVGKRFLDHCQIELIDDPCILLLNQQRWLLSHGDVLCTDDVQYMQFRQLCRNPAWQQALLVKPLAERRIIAQQLRMQSKASQQDKTFTDLNNAAVMQWLEQTNCQVLLHGHTHHPDEHQLDNGKLRIVLSDWEFDEGPARAEILRLSRNQQQDWDWVRLPIATD